MRKFWKKNQYKYYYVFEWNGYPEVIKEDSMQKAIDNIFWLWFLGGSKSSIVFKFSNDPEALQGTHELKHNRNLFDEQIKATPVS